MTMHLMPAFVNTNATCKRKPSNSKRAAQSRAEHEAWVLSMTKGRTPDKKALYRLRKPEYDSASDTKQLAKSGVTPGACVKRPDMVYSGERKLLGIATMHKSNMVPVFAKQDAEDIARMRRG